MTRIRSIDTKPLGFSDRTFVSIAGEIPHDNLIALFDRLTLEYHVIAGNTTHVSERSLPANNFWNHARNEPRVRPQLIKFLRVQVVPQHATRNRVSRRVVAADNQLDQVAQILHRVHVTGCWVMRHKRNQIIVFGRVPIEPFMP